MTLVLPERELLAVRTATGFVGRHGHEPTAVVRAPGRVNLIGEHTDYNGGPCLPLALPHTTCAAVALRDDGRVHASTGSAGHPPLDVPTASLTPGSVTGWGAYVAGVVWALREEGYAVPGLAVHLDSTVPPGAGLGSSAALAAAVAVAVTAVVPRAAGADTATGLGGDPVLAACLRAEREFVGAPTGGMDQATSLHAVTGHALLLDFATDPPAERPVPLAWLTAEHALLVVDSGVSHDHTTGGYGARRAECERAAHRLGVDNLAAAELPAVTTLSPGPERCRATHVVTETVRMHRAVTALESGDAVGLGSLLTESHVSLRDDFAVSVPELDLLADTAVAHGALGARLTGGGFGGSLVTLVPRRHEQTVPQAVCRAAREHGSPEPTVLEVTPAGPATVVPQQEWSER